MKKMIIYTLVIIMCLISLQSIDATSISVHPGDSIQSAVNTASAGDSITIYDNNNSAYTYKESVYINKKISIKASGNVTIAAKNSSASVFCLSSGASGSSIQNFGLSNSNYCIIVSNANNCLISGNNIKGASLVGIQFYGNVNNSRVLNNIITVVSSDYGNGISFEYGNCTNNVLDGNTINNFLNGILFNDNSENNTIKNNRVSCTGFTGAGIYSTDNSRSMQITGNIITGAEDGIAIQQMGTNTALNYLISGNTISGNKNGAWIVLCNSTISFNNALQNNVS